MSHRSSESGTGMPASFIWLANSSFSCSGTSTCTSHCCHTRCASPSCQRCLATTTAFTCTLFLHIDEATDLGKTLISLQRNPALQYKQSRVSQRVTINQSVGRNAMHKVEPNRHTCMTRSLHLDRASSAFSTGMSLMAASSFFLMPWLAA